MKDVLQGEGSGGSRTGKKGPSKGQFQPGSRGALECKLCPEFVSSGGKGAGHLQLATSEGHCKGHKSPDISALCMGKAAAQVESSE